MLDDVPLLLALCTGLVSVIGTLAIHRVSQLEEAQRAHARSAQRIEGTVTKTDALVP